MSLGKVIRKGRSVPGTYQPCGHMARFPELLRESRGETMNPSTFARSLWVGRGCACISPSGWQIGYGDMGEGETEAEAQR